MASTSGGSFIPKRSTGKVTPVRSSRRIYIVSYIAYVLFFGTLIAVIGIFVLKQQAENTLDSYIAQVNAQRQNQIETQIEEIRTVDQRLQSAKQILDWQVAVSKLFEELEKITVNSVQLHAFTYTRATGDSAELTFGGSTDSFDVLLFQRQVMEQSDFFNAAKISEVSYGQGGDAIEGANRSGSVTSSANSEIATISFMFSDNAIVQHIGYTPRSFEGSDAPATTDAVGAAAAPESATSSEGTLRNQ